jgi:hypothetical protein
MRRLGTYHPIFRRSWSIYLILQGHILRHGSGYTTSTLIRCPCPRYTRRDLRLCHFIMPLCGFCVLVERLIVADSRYVNSRGGIDVDIWNRNEETSLYLASSRGKLDVVRFLVERGVDIHTTNNKG